MAWGERRPSVSGWSNPRTSASYLSVIGLSLAFITTLVVSFFFMEFLGVEFFLFALVGVSIGAVYAVISFRSLAIPFYVLILAVGLLRFVWAIKAPVLPDLYFDRISLIWLTIVFMVTFFAHGRKLKKPYAMDLLILAHGLFLMFRILTTNSIYFHIWTMSIMTPYLVYFFAKNIMVTEKQIRILLWLLLILSIYYTVTSIAEKFHVNQLLFPRYMLEPPPQFAGRSNGPFRNAGIFGNAVGMLLPINLYFIATVRSWFGRALLMLNLAAGFGALYFTYTRGSWIAGVACLIVVVLLNRGHYLKTVLPVLIVVPFFALFFLGLGQDKFMKERVENEDTIGSRVGTMVTGLRVWRDYPFLGCGTYQFHIYRDNYIEPVEAPGLGTIRFAQFRNTPAHDMYLGPLAEDGLVGTGLQFAIYFMFFRALMKNYRHRRNGNHFAIFIIPIIGGIFASYLLGGLTISYRHTSILGVLFYMMAGITYGYEPPESDPKENPQEMREVK